MVTGCLCRSRSERKVIYQKPDRLYQNTLRLYRSRPSWNQNIDLPEKLRRSPKKAQNRENKRILGRSIDERPASVNDRIEFGHWEADLVIGSKSDDDDALLTMIERMTREYWMIRVPGRDPNGVMAALSAVRSQYKEHWDDLFKTITTDNGSEFATLSDLEGLSKTLVYFAHPYTSCEKGSVERHNGLIRRFIPKGKRIDSSSDEQLAQIEIWCNGLPVYKLNGQRTYHIMMLCTFSVNSL